jgi:GT2 family glycosyltransferase/glycosyltransferase involved in cell wall biosynthesis
MPWADLTPFPDWLVIAQEPWDAVERRNQLLIRALAARHPRARFLFAELPLRSRDLLRWRWPRARPVASNIWAIRPIRMLPGPALSERSDWLEAAQVRAAARALGIFAPVLWTQDPRAATLVDRLGVERVVYDLTDDWAAFESDPARRAVVAERIERLGRRAALVLACSRPLERAARAWGGRVAHLPNAVEPPTAPRGGTDGRQPGPCGVRTSASPEPAEPAEIAGLPRPRLGYVGTLHPSRLDVELLAELAGRRKAWSFVLLGPHELTAEQSGRLLGLANVHYVGVRPHAEVRRYLEALDVGLLPHTVTEFTRSLDPLKLYEYLAAGLPIVATDLGHAPELAVHLTIADSALAFAVECERAIAQDTPERAAARRAAVAAATWEARAETLETELSAAGVTPASRGPAPPGQGVSAVVVSHNTRDLLERCLLGLSVQAWPGLQTIVVDNASTDGSRELVRSRFPEVELIELDENTGFARANNAGFERCRGEHVLLVNSDAFLAPGALAELVATADRHPEAAVVGPRLRNVDGTLQRSAWPFPNAGRLLLEAVGGHRPLRRIGLLEDLGTWGHDEERAVDFLVGACLLVRTDALREVGGFDPGFFLYAEEADLQRRLAARGWSVVLAPRASVTHVGGASSRASLTRLRSHYAGQRRYLRRHGTTVSLPAARLALLVGSLLRGRWDGVRVALEPQPGASASR